MQPMIFKSNFDAQDTSDIETSLTNCIVYDAFAPENAGLLEQMKVPRLPYVIDKEIVLTSTPPFTVGTVTLRFSCRDYAGNNVGGDDVFGLTINSEAKDISNNNGLLEVTFDCPEPNNILVEIWAAGYIPYAAEITIKTEAKELALSENLFTNPEDINMLPKGVTVIKTEEPA